MTQKLSKQLEQAQCFHCNRLYCKPEDFLAKVEALEVENETLKKATAPAKIHLQIKVQKLEARLEAAEKFCKAFWWDGPDLCMSDDAGILLQQWQKLVKEME